MPNTYQSTHWSGIQIDNIYPVGSLYFSVNNIDPGTLFGGTWERIQDKFLLCAGSTYAAGTTGGNATSGGPSNNTSGGPSNNTSGGPSTNTSGGPSTNTSGGTAITMAQLPVDTVVRTNKGTSGSGSTSGWTAAVGSGTWASHRMNDGLNMSWGQTHTHTLSSHTHNLSSHTHSLSSHTHSLQSHTHSCLPPYLAVYVWQRIS